MSKLKNSDTAAKLNEQLRGRRVSEVMQTAPESLTIRFDDGAQLLVESAKGSLVMTVERPGLIASSSTQPTLRQREYLAFIAKYIARFGRAPAESDIERHFLVSAPSVNQMMQMLERKGFIARQPGVARSIKLCVNLSST